MGSLVCAVFNDDVDVAVFFVISFCSRAIDYAAAVLYVFF
jgi:hypothetical protein